MAQRKQYSGEFKARVVLQALKGQHSSVTGATLTGTAGGGPADWAFCCWQALVSNASTKPASEATTLCRDTCLCLETVNPRRT